MGIFSALMGHASEVSVAKIAQEFQPILVDGEEIEIAFKLVRDRCVYQQAPDTGKQGLTGTKVDYETIPYSSIKKFSKESAGMLDLDAEIKIWITGDPQPIKKEFKKDQNINEVYRILSHYVLG